MSVARSRSPERNRHYGEHDIYRPKTMDYRDRSPMNGGGHYSENSRDYGSNMHSGRYIPNRDMGRMAPANANSDQARRVYVGNLSYDVKWHHLKDFMRQAGDVLFADVLLLPNGMSKGCGIVEYRTSEDAQRAIQTLSNQNLLGRLVYIREDRESEARFGSIPTASRSRGGGERAYALVSDLPDGTTWRELKTFFLNTHKIPIESVGYVDAVSRTATVELLPQYLTSFIESFNNVMYNNKSQLRVERTGPPAAGGFGGDRSHFNSFHPPQGVENYNTGRPQYVTSGGTNTPLTENATSGGEPSKRIYVGNLPWATTREDLQELFVTIGQVDDTGIVYNRAGRSCGSGVVEFNTPEEAADAIKRFDGYSYGKRPLHLSYVKYQAPGIPLGPMSMNMF